MFKIYEVKAKSVFHKTKIPDADWGVNYYRGCTHNCIYCYLKFLCRWRKQKEKWGEFVDVKINAPELVAKESKNKKGVAILCTGGDAYQPIEKKYQLTRKVLQNLNTNLRLLVLTKSNLIVRDVDLFRRFKRCELGLTITALNESVKKVFEPLSPSSHARLDALKKIKG
ncbi:hypothetical protein DRP05_05310 [Archaeoglobales archaeon]|nr:MAG: hypothetical protein DRP05_05310 [Archaeoglobales archaeon]